MATLILIITTFLSICFVLGSIALVHELGHFLTAKLTGIWVIEFAIGFGNRIFKRKWGETIYSIRPFPLGGFVRLAGMDPEEDEEPEKGKEGETPAEPPPPPADPDDVLPKLNPDDPRGFPVKPRWVKTLVLGAGSFMNLVWAIVLFILIYAFNGGPVTNIAVLGVARDQPAAMAGIKAGDIITAIEGKKIEDWGDGVKMIQQSTGKTIVLDVSRNHPVPQAGLAGGILQDDMANTPGAYEIYNSETLKFSVVPTEVPLSDGLFDNMRKWFRSVFGYSGSGRIGISLAPNKIDFQILPIWKASEKGFEDALSIIGRTLEGLLKMLIRETQADVAGPVKIMQMIKDQSKKGIFDLLYLTAILSINIGLINMLPLPVLDGGRIVFVLLEAFFAFLNMLTGIKLAITPKLEEQVHFVGLMFLLVLLVLVTYVDIRSFF